MAVQACTVGAFVQSQFSIKDGVGTCLSASQLSQFSSSSLVVFDVRLSCARAHLKMSRAPRTSTWAARRTSVRSEAKSGTPVNNSYKTYKKRLETAHSSGKIWRPELAT